MTITIRKVFESGEDANLEVTKGEYGGDWVHVYSSGPANELHFGKVSLIMTNKMALELAAAIIATTKDVE